MRRKTKVLCSMICIVSFFFTFSLSALASPQDVAKSSPKAWGLHRIHGQDRFETSISVANELNANAQVQNIILASGYSFPDALAASTLASQLKAPIILGGPGVKDSMASLNYVKEHLVSGGTVTIIGGGGVISHKVEEWLLDNGFKVNRFGGSDRFATNDLILNQLNVAQGTPVIITNSENFPDALGISSLAASKGWPILLSNPGNLSPTVQAFLSSDKPTTVYIVGGEGVMRESILNQIRTLSPGTQIQRLGGSDRFETLSKILNMFYPHPSQIYVANGDDFADALSGSPLAASQNAPILLVNPKSNQLPQSIENYLITLRNNNVQPQVNVLGGDSAVPERLLNQIDDILQSNSGTTTPSTISETMWASNPSTTGLTVTMSPALYGLTKENFKLFDNTGYYVGVTGAVTSDGGVTYSLNASLIAGHTYTLTASKTGYTFGTVQQVVVPSWSTINETMWVSNPSTTGFTVTVSPALYGLTKENFKLFDNTGYYVGVTGAVTSDGGVTYSLSANLIAGHTYTLTASKTGYTFGTVQQVVVPSSSTINETMWVSNPSTTGFTLTVSPALYGLNVSNFILMDGNTSVGLGLASIVNNGSTYQIVAALAPGKTYTLRVVKDGYNFGIAQYVAVPLAATVSSAVTSGNMHIILTMSDKLTGEIGSPEAFAITGVVSNPRVTNVTVSGSMVVLTLNAPIVSSDSSIRVSYTRTGINDLTNGTPVANFSNMYVSNNL